MDGSELQRFGLFITILVIIFEIAKFNLENKNQIFDNVVNFINMESYGTSLNTEKLAQNAETQDSKTQNSNTRNLPILTKHKG